MSTAGALDGGSSTMPDVGVSFVIPAYRRIGKSKIRFVRDALRTGQILCSAILLYNPIKLFVLLSGATCLIGLGLVAVGLMAGGRFGASG